jgi:hypothetical protein
MVSWCRGENRDQVELPKDRSRTAPTDAGRLTNDGTFSRQYNDSGMPHFVGITWICKTTPLRRFWRSGGCSGDTAGRVSGS